MSINDIRIGGFDKPKTDYDQCEIGQTYKFYKHCSSKETFCEVLDKDILNRVFYRVFNNEDEDAYCIWDYQDYTRLFGGAKGCIFQTNDKAIADVNWEDLKTKLSQEEIDAKFDNLMNIGSNTKPNNDPEISQKWAEYESKVMGWNGR